MAEEIGNSDSIIQIDQAYIDRVYAERAKDVGQPVKAPQLLKSGEYVLIKEEMTAGDDRLIKNASVKTSGSGKHVNVTVLIGDIQLVTLQRMIKGWHLVRTVMGPTGQPQQGVLPFSTANVEKLPRKLYNFLKDEIDRLNPDEEVDENGESPLSPSVVDSSLDSPLAEQSYRLK